MSGRPGSREGFRIIADACGAIPFLRPEGRAPEWNGERARLGYRFPHPRGKPGRSEMIRTFMRIPRAGRWPGAFGRRPATGARTLVRRGVGVRKSSECP